ncbi:MAG TPA: hypothetical protein VKI65_15230 [Gemmataceae bacterium]|nr:hypothetical protein [Gemmataceae bacterium]
MSKPRNKSTSVAARNRPRRPPSARASQKRPQTVSADRAKLIAIEYCLFHYPTLYTGNVPRRSVDFSQWVVPIVLASPSHGVMGEVGELGIDARTGQVIRSTGRSRVVAAGERLYQEWGNAADRCSARQRMIPARSPVCA